MKKIIIMLLMLSLMSVSYAELEVIVTLPEFKVVINEHEINSITAKYPLIQYKNITYIPMTWNMCNALGLNVSYSEENGLSISNVGRKALINIDNSGSNILKENYSAKIVDYKVILNNVEIDNSLEDYPLLNFRGITYFPLTWKFAHDEFRWNYLYTETTGLKIDSVDVEPIVVDEQEDENVEQSEEVSEEYKEQYPSEFFSYSMFEGLEIAEAYGDKTYFRKVTHTTDVYDESWNYRYKTSSHAYHPNYSLRSVKPKREVRFNNDEDVAFYEANSRYMKKCFSEYGRVLVDDGSAPGVYNTNDLYIRYYGDDKAVITLMGPSYELLENSILTSAKHVFDEERGDRIAQFIVKIIQERYENEENPITIVYDDAVHNSEFYVDGYFIMFSQYRYMRNGVRVNMLTVIMK